jgi:cholesterol oxidase
MVHLSSQVENIKNHYSVVVIGSGYGGGIAASRLARAGQQVCLLERGRELQPGEYPDTLPEVLAHVQVDTPDMHIGSRTGLYDLRVNEDINVFAGCGLGGTSLVNANVSLPADPRVFDDPRWPVGFRQDVPTLLAEGYKHAQDMLKPVPYPDDFPKLQKLEALENSAKFHQQKFYRPPINVTFQDGVSPAGVEQQACKLCGDCVTGCNHAAKNTVLMNYLPDAVNHGAEIYTQIDVRRLERKDNQWLIHYQLLDTGREQFDAPELFITADIVVLAGGMMGSTEVLLRSQATGLSLSSTVGQHFTGNGDVLAFGYDGKNPISGIGFGNLPVQGRTPVGPCISGVIDDRAQQSPVELGMVIEEGSIPGALGAMLSAGLAALAPWSGKELAADAGEFIEERTREAESLIMGPYYGAIENTQTYLVMTHDDANGHMTLEDDRLRLHWPGVGNQPVFTRVSERLKQVTAPLGGVFLNNPLWSDLTNHNLITVHPLGGCVMAEDAAGGVVNHKGQVFSAQSGTAVYDNLYVCDGSVIPRALGVNPLLTISAVAERCCARIARDRGWHIDYSLAPVPRVVPLQAQGAGLRFTETMKGFFSTRVTDDFEKGRAQGEQDHSPMQFTLTVISDDLEKMLTEPGHKARMAGTLTAQALSTKPLSISQGQFQLLVNDPDSVNTRRMCYSMILISEEGKSFSFSGFKQIQNDGIFNIWRDTSTLFVTVADAGGAVIGKGILNIEPEDLMRQLTTVEITNTESIAERINGVVRFGKFFAATLFDIYGGALAVANEFQATPLPRKKRPLRMSAPQVYDFPAEDGIGLRLTRYQGGKKGPVLLSPGYGTSTLAFTIDTIDTNLPEYLFANEYDIWLFDYRASPALPASRTQFSLDDVAIKDYPAAVAKVREITGAADIQVMVHCVGSLTFLMSMLSGKLQGIRSAICSQLSFFPITSPENEVKAAFNIGSFLEALDIDTLNTDFDSDRWDDILADAILKLNFDGPPCNSAVCRRIWMIYGEVFGHGQLNDATHQAVHEMFGIANITAFNHILTMIREGKIVDKDGNDVYLPNIGRLKIPLTLFQAEGNKLFLPEGTEKTFNLLCEKNGANGYELIVVPKYQHMDCFIGKNAASDIFPTILAQLDSQNPIFTAAAAAGTES